MPKSKLPRLLRAWPVALAALAVALPDAAGAAGRGLRPGAMIAQASATLSADAAAERVRAESGGRILDVRPERGPGGARVYRVKVLLEGGRVRIYRVDAATGRILR